MFPAGNGIKPPRSCWIIIYSWQLLLLLPQTAPCWNYHHHYQPHYTNGGALPLILIQTIRGLWHHQSPPRTAWTRGCEISIHHVTVTKAAARDIIDHEAYRRAVTRFRKYSSCTVTEITDHNSKPLPRCESARFNVAALNRSQHETLEFTQPTAVQKKCDVIT